MAKIALYSANNGSHVTGTASTVTSHEAKDNIRLKRMSGRRRICRFAVLQLILGSAAVLIGVLSLIYGVPTESFPFFLGVPLWGGIFVVLAGVCGVLAGRHTDESDGSVSTKEKCMVIGNYVMTLLSLILSVTMPVFGGLGVYYCLNPGSTVTSRSGSRYFITVIRCEPHRDANLALSGVSLAIGILIVLLSFPILGFFCCYAHVYGFQSRQQRRQEMIQMQQDINRLKEQINAQNGQHWLNDAKTGIGP